MIPELGRSPGEGKGYPLQCSGLEASMGYSLRSCKESETTRQLSLSVSHTHTHTHTHTGFPGGPVVKNLPANTGDAGDSGPIPGSGRSPDEGNCNPLQYSCLENPMDRGVWWDTVHGVVKNHTQLSD